MTKQLYKKLPALLLTLIVGLMATSTAFGAATIVIENVDAAGVGFNDTTPVSPVGGNSGTTIGQQRLIAFQSAASIWGATLTSGPTITIRASWAPLDCSANSGVLGSAGNSGSIFRDFPGSVPGTWYGNALANAIRNTDLNGATHEINAQFNFNLGTSGCLQSLHWYYGLDTNTDFNGINLVTVLLHEFGHGLGFQTFTSSSSGAQISGFPSIYDRFLFDNSTSKTWPQMTDAERVASAINTNNLVWNGPQVVSDAATVLASGSPRLRVNSPPAIAGNYEVGTAAFGPEVNASGVTAGVVQALDPSDGAGAATTDACSPLTNAADVSGKIALIDRGTCSFVVKVKIAQNAGAVGVIIVNNINGGPPGMAGSDSTIMIPTVSITNLNGDSIKAQLAAGVNATLLFDLSARAGADASGRPRMYAPNPREAGSSVSHWDTSAFPDQLMEPNISDGLSHSVVPPQDLTFSLLRDIGWCSGCPQPSPTPSPSPPVNNDFANAQIIGGFTGSVNGTNVGANKETGEPSHEPGGNAGGGSVWYQWQAPSTGSVTMTTAGSNFDTLLAVYTGGSVSALTAIVKNDDVNPGVTTTSAVTFSATAGTVYRIAVDGFDNDRGNIVLNWTHKTDQTITFPALADKTFGDAPFTVSATATSGLPVSFSIVSGPATISGNTVTITGAGTITVRASQSGNATYNAATPVDRSFIAKANQTITFNALADKSFGDAPFNVSATSTSGLPVSFSIVSGPATISGNTVTITGVGVVTVRASQAGNANFNAATPVDRTFTVAKANQTITFNALADKTFGDAPFTISATATSGLPVSFIIVSGPATISGNTVTITGAGTITVRASQSGNATYNAATPVDRSFIAKANQTINFNVLADKSFGDAPFNASATSSSGLSVSFSIVSGPATISGNTITIAGVGVVTVRASQAGDANFNAATPVDRTFTVVKANQTITFNPLSGKTYGDPPFNLNATSSSGLPVMFEVFSGFATISGNNIVTITGAGPVTIRAMQPGNSNYNPALTVDQSFTVNKANQTITLDVIANKTLGDAPFNVSGSSSSGLPVSFSLVSGPATISGNTITIAGVGVVTVRASQAGDANFNAATSVDRTFTVEAGTFQPVVLTVDQVEIKTWIFQGRTYAYLKLSFPNAGYRVANWGQPVRAGNDFSADAAVEKFTGASVQAVTTTAQIYDLGPLADGNYTFAFRNSGTVVKSQAFTVSSATPPPNPIDNAREFVKQQYRDFLNREADQAGEDFWTDNITKCSDPARRPPDQMGQTEAQCTIRQRETTSGAFFLSPEFQYTGYYVYRMYQGALGRQPKLSEFTPDAQFVGAGIIVNGQLSGALINQNKADFAQQFVNCTDPAKYRCAEFKTIYDGLSNQQYVDKLFQTTGVNASASDRTALVNGLNSGTETRASVLQKVVDSIVVIAEGNQQFTTSYGQAFYNSEFNRAFVQMEYFGYMKRDPDDAGYAFWLGKLNQFGGNFVNAEMVLAFISSPEYRARFGQP